MMRSMDLGWGTADHLQAYTSLRGLGEQSREPGPRIWMWWMVLLLGIGLIWAQAFRLQVVEGANFKGKTDQQRVRKVSLPASRGIIYDREGRALVTNVPIYRQVSWDFEKGLVLTTINRDQMLSITSENKDALILEAVDRHYVYDTVFAHVMGYMGEVTSNELEQQVTETSCTKIKELGSMVGKTGIEEAYDCYLRGDDGGYLLEVDTGGSMIRQIGKQEPVAGSPIHLTVDLELQQIVMQAMKEKIGSVIVSNPTNGDILSMVSTPTYDPNTFGLVARSQKPNERNSRVQQLFTDERMPLLNRTIAAVYPPGSLFKIITSVAGMEEGKVTAKDTYVDTGAVSLGEYTFRNWYLTQYGSTEGEINLAKALARSTDTFFYDLGGRIGPEKMAEWARSFGLGKESGLRLSGELRGLVPDPTWKLESRDERWYLGNTYHMSIGQGDVLTTPLQAHGIAGVVANEGVRCNHRLVSDQQDVTCNDLEISQEALATVMDGLVQACKPGGTGVPFFDAPWTVGCKTGTAEFGPRKEDGTRDTHAWFTVFGPLVEDESIGWKLDERVEPMLVTVVIEEGGGGSSEAAPVAKQVLDYWFQHKNYQPDDSYVGGQNNQVEDKNNTEDPSDSGDEQGTVSD